MPFNGIVNKKIGEALAAARKKEKLTQAKMANRISLGLKGNKFSSRQYQNYEAGEFPEYKSDVVKEIDKILGTHFYELLYATNVPPDTNIKYGKEINSEEFIKVLNRIIDFAEHSFAEIKIAKDEIKEAKNETIEVLKEERNKGQDRKAI